MAANVQTLKNYALKKSACSYVSKNTHTLVLLWWQKSSVAAFKAEFEALERIAQNTEGCALSINDLQSLTKKTTRLPCRKLDV